MNGKLFHVDICQDVCGDTRTRVLQSKSHIKVSDSVRARNGVSKVGPQVVKCSKSRTQRLGDAVHGVYRVSTKLEREIQHSIASAGTTAQSYTFTRRHDATGTVGYSEPDPEVYMSEEWQVIHSSVQYGEARL